MAKQVKIVEAKPELTVYRRSEVRLDLPPNRRPGLPEYRAGASYLRRFLAEVSRHSNDEDPEIRVYGGSIVWSRTDELSEGA